MNVWIGALTAFLISFLTSLLTALNGDDVVSIRDIAEKQWWIMILGPLISALKDSQSVNFRIMTNKVTGSGDGGGVGQLPKRGE